MTVSLTLFISASLFVRLVSVPLAVAMCVIAAVIPPIAAFTANKRESDDYWWDETDGGAGGPSTGQQDAARTPFEDGSPDAPPPPAQPSDPLDPSGGPAPNDPTLDELLWEEELRGYNGERFGRES